MKLLIVADSHGDVSLLKNNEELVNSCDMIIHLGDHDYDIDKFSEFTDKPIVAVRGNNDYTDRFEFEKIIRVGNHKIFLTHGHKYKVHSGVERLYYKAQEVAADIALYGHTHIFDYENDGEIIILNPSSPSLSRDGRNSFVIMDVSDEDVKVERIVENS